MSVTKKIKIKAKITKNYLFSKKTIENYQWQEVQKLLKRVFKDNEFYKEKYKQAGFTKASQIKSLKDISKLPLCTKAELIADQEAYPPFGRNATVGVPFYVKPTTGTSGFNFYVPSSAADLERRNKAGAELYKLTIFQHPEGEKSMFMMTGSALVYVNDQLLKTGSHSYPPDDFSELGNLKRIIGQKITHIELTQTKFAKLMEVAKANNIDLRKSNLETVIITGEQGGGIKNLRKHVEKATGAKCIFLAGSSEMGLIAVSCLYDDYNPHLFENSTYIEVIDPETGKASDKGEMIITSLYRHDYPLIRYRTGDYVEVFREKCKCGMESLKIRNAQFVRYPNIFKLGNKQVNTLEIEDIFRKHNGLNEFAVEFYSKNKSETELEILVKIEHEPTNKADKFTKLKSDLEKLFKHQVIMAVLPKGSIIRIGVKSYKVVDFRKTLKPLIKPKLSVNLLDKLLQLITTIPIKISLLQYQSLSNKINKKP